MFFWACLYSAGTQHGNLHPAGWPTLFCGPTQEPVLDTANTGKKSEEVFEKMFHWKQVQERQDWGGSTTGSGAAETAASVMGSGVSGSHEGRSIKFRLCYSGVSSAVRELPLRSSPKVSLSSSSTVSVFVCPRLCPSPSSPLPVVVPGGWSRGRRLSVRCFTSRIWKPPWRACFQFVRYYVKCGELVIKTRLLCCDVFP